MKMFDMPKTRPRNHFDQHYFRIKKSQRMDRHFVYVHERDEGGGWAVGVA